MKRDCCIYPVLTTPEPKMAKILLQKPSMLTDLCQIVLKATTNQTNKLHTHCMHELLKFSAKMVFLNHILVKSCKPLNKSKK